MKKTIIWLILLNMPFQLFGMHLLRKKKKELIRRIPVQKRIQVYRQTGILILPMPHNQHPSTLYNLGMRKKSSKTICPWKNSYWKSIKPRKITPQRSVFIRPTSKHYFSTKYYYAPPKLPSFEPTREYPYAFARLCKKIRQKHMSSSLIKRQPAKKKRKKHYFVRRSDNLQELKFKK